MTTTPRAFVPGRHERTKISTPPTLTTLSSFIVSVRASGMATSPRWETGSYQLLVERCVEQIVHCRRWLVARHEALAEVARKVVVRCAGACLDNAADGARESLLHFQSRKRVDDCRHLSLRQLPVAPAAPIEPDAR